MNDELVKQCRDCIDCLCGDCKYEHLQKPGNFVQCMNALLGEAADAIEELICDLADEHNARLDAEERQRWIPVTKRLPEAERKSYWVCTDTGYQCECRWTNNRFGIRELDEWGWCLFDIPPYQKVVAWMPLPEPPGECE